MSVNKHLWHKRTRRYRNAHPEEEVSDGEALWYGLKVFFYFCMSIVIFSLVIVLLFN